MIAHGAPNLSSRGTSTPRQTVGAADPHSFATKRFGVSVGDLSAKLVLEGLCWNSGYAPTQVTPNQSRIHFRESPRRGKSYVSMVHFAAVRFDCKGHAKDETTIVQGSNQSTS